MTHGWMVNHKKPKSAVPSEVSAWDVVVLSFRLMYQRIQVWIQANMLFVLISLPVATLPGGRAAMVHAVMQGLRDPSGVVVSMRQSMVRGFRQHAFRAFLASLIQLGVLVMILISIYYWVTQETSWGRYVSILSFYALFLWWTSSVYLFPVLVAHQAQPISKVIRESVRLAWQHPFESLLFSVVIGLLQLFGMVLLGPILLMIPVLVSILQVHGYWYVTGSLIPGLLTEEEYAVIQYHK